MFIRDNIIIDDELEFRIGMSLTDAKNMLHGHSCQIFEKDEGNSGYIKLKYVDFYGVRGTCMLFFPKGNLYQIEISCDWNNYALDVDDETQQLNAIETIIDRCEKTFTEVFGKPVYNGRYHKLRYEFQSRLINTALSRDNDVYTVMIR